MPNGKEGNGRKPVGFLLFVSFCLSHWGNRQVSPMRKGGLVGRPFLLYVDRDWCATYLAILSQPFIFGSFLHCSAVGALSAATTANDAAAKVAASRTAMSFFTLTLPYGGWYYDDIAPSGALAPAEARRGVYRYGKLLARLFARASTRSNHGGLTRPCAAGYRMFPSWLWHFGLSSAHDIPSGKKLRKARIARGWDN